MIFGKVGKRSNRYATPPLKSYIPYPKVVYLRYKLPPVRAGINADSIHGNS